MASWTTSQAHGEIAPDPRPPRRHRALEREWAKIHEGFAGQRCVACGQPYQSLHHIVPKSQGGDDLKENLVPLCGDGTRGCHGQLESHGPQWERVAGHVRAYVMARESRMRYVLDRIGQARFDARYPCPPFLALGDLDRYRSTDPWLREDQS